MSQRRAVVTGGNKGIGKACAAKLLAAGHAVAITGRDTAALEAAAKELGDLGEVETAAFDVADADAVAAFFDGRACDILVNNAGVEQSAPIHRTTFEDWNRTLTINAGGVFLCTQAALAGMRERGWGRVITVASAAGHHAIPYAPAYTASKHAAVGFMRSVAAETAGTGITANSVCPGFVRTEMTERTVSRIVDKTGRSEDEAAATVAHLQPLGRLIEPDEVAAAVAFFASEEAAAISGQSIILDGGGIQQ